MTLHYYFDPLCGWCYGAAPLMQAAAGLPGIRLRLHAGGMMSGARRRPVDAALRAYVSVHDQRIAALTGQPFGDAYVNGLLCDNTAVLDSTPPIQAILAAELAGVAPLTMLARLQQAHYVAGERIADAAVLRRIAADLGLDAADFEAKMHQAAAQVAPHIEATQRDMARLGLRGYPSVVLARDGSLRVIDISAHLGDPAGFADAVRTGLDTPNATDAASLCRIDPASGNTC
ncbi:DsbA family protein [Denitromonas iodatirespirans]|uniref:DsbA family protein n=1 Tax=Denitromonas iodatirespirans TaxID=2795389 RepID=UPI001E4F6B8F|nr:DsbA family protein [Denitromonas iodatirespirans]